MATLTPKQTATVEDFIDSADAINISYDILSLKNLLSNENVSIVVYNVLDDYYDEMMDITIDYEFSNAEFDKYFQAPKLLSNYLYGNTELDFIIMRINGIYDPKDLIMRTVKLIHKSDMITLISRIYNANKKFIDEYNERNNE